jgi:hypothetical protein
MNGKEEPVFKEDKPGFSSPVTWQKHGLNNLAAELRYSGIRVDRFFDGWRQRG